MDEHQQKLQDYIYTQIQAGQTPDEISGQLHAAGWPADQVQQAFLGVQSQVIPTTMQQNNPGQHAEQPQANGKRRGRIKMGWILFKQSMRILNNNRYLLRFLLMTWVVIIITEAILFAIIWFAYNSFVDANGNNTLQWYIFCFFAYLTIYSLINFYAAALSSNILDIFDGKRQPYAAYIQAARKRAWPIFVFSVFEAIIGMFLRFVVERIRWIGWILAWLLGTVWSIGTMFVLPIIMHTDESAPRAIKDSIKFFKKTWGENITAKVTVNTPLALVNIALCFLFGLLFWPVAATGSIVLIWIFIIVYLFLIISLAILGSFANSLINVALYYYATTGQVPPSFSSDMLNGVFINRRFFKKHQKGAPA